MYACLSGMYFSSLNFCWYSFNDHYRYLSLNIIPIFYMYLGVWSSIQTDLDICAFAMLRLLKMILYLKTSRYLLSLRSRKKKKKKVVYVIIIIKFCYQWIFIATFLSFTYVYIECYCCRANIYYLSRDSKS